MSIAILCPTRKRPNQLKKMCESVTATVAQKENILTYPLIDEDGYESYAETVANLPPRQYATSFGLPTVHKWNLAANDAYRDGKKLFILGADDMVFCTPLWDKALLDHYNALDNKIHVYHFQDSRDPEGTPHPIVTREYIEAMGYFLPPLFLHWYVDSWTVYMAKKNGCFTHMKDYLLMHDKPSDRGEGDETHNRIRQMGWHERDKWVNDHCQHILEAETKRLYQTICNVDVVEC